MSDSDTPTARRYRSADADMIDNELLVTPGSNGDWYLTIVPTGQRFGPTVRITTSGAKRGMEHVPRGVRALYDSLGGVSQHDARPSTCVAVLVTNASNPEEVCLIKHGARGTWEMPGGKMYFGETIAQAAKREGMEEAGLDITISQDPVRAENGQRGVVVLLCRGTAEGTPTAGSDAVDARWFHRDEIPWEELSSIISAETLRTWAFGPGVVPKPSVPSIKVGFDIGGVLSKYPHLLRPLIDVLLAAPDIEVHVLSDMHPREKCVRVVHENGFRIPAARIHSCDYDEHGEECKAEKAKEIGLDVLVDDFLAYVGTVDGPRLRLLVMPDPTRDYYHPTWKTDGTEGNFGRRRANREKAPFDLPPLGVVEDRTHAQRVADGDACDDTTTDGEVEDCR